MASGGNARQRSISVPWDILAQTKNQVLKKEALEKRQRGRSHRSRERILKFQKRFVVLTFNFLQYFDNEKAKYPKGKFPVCDIQIVETVRHGEFGGNCKYFQIGNLQEVMYFGATSVKQQNEWMDAIRYAATECGNKMLDTYHPGVHKKGRWSCCDDVGKETRGCSAICHSIQTTSSFKFSPKVSPRRSELTLPVPGLGDNEDKLEVPASAPTSLQFQGSADTFETAYNKKLFFPLKKWTSSQISDDSGLDSEYGKSPSRLSMSSIATKEDTSFSEFKKHEQTLKKKDNPELQLLSIADVNINADENGSLLKTTETMCQNYHIKLGHFKGNSSLKTLCFRSLDELVTATSHEVYFLTINSLQGRSVPIYTDSDDEIISLSTWRSMVAVKERTKITLLDSDAANSRLTISSNSVCHADFTPDGSSLIIAGSYTNISYSKESEKLKNIKVQTLPLSELIPQGSELICLLLHPDPREPYAALMVPDELTNILYLYIYNYKTKKSHRQRICIGAFQPSQVPHAVFSHFNLKLYILYGNILSVLNVGDTSMQQEKLGHFQDKQVACMKLSSIGKDLAIVLKNGTILMFDGQTDRINYCYKIEMPVSISTLTFSFNDIIMAVVSDTGELSLFKNSPLQHPSEGLTMKTIEIPRSGKENVILGDDISVDFPEDFIEETSLEFDYAITAGESFGPFSLPKGSRLISAILSLHPKKDVDFKKAIKITMPHTLHSEEDGLVFCKAKVTDFSSLNDQKVLTFEVPSDQKVSQFSKQQQIEDGTEVKVSFASWDTLHSCHLCMTTKPSPNTRNITEDNTLFFIEAKPRNLGKSREFTIEYIVTEFLKPCLKTVEEQYPNKDYHKKKLVFSFLQSHDAIAINIVNACQLESDGWKATIEGRKKISRRDMNFTDFQIATLRFMCDEKEYPPHFSIRMSSISEEHMPKKSQLKFTLAGAQERACGGELCREVELLASDICPPEKDSVGGDDSCQARTIQSCLVPIAEEVKDPKSFCIRLFSAMILTRSQLDRLTSLPVQMNKDKTSQNCDILLEVHRNVSNNFMLFEPFCNVLQTMNYQSCYDLLKENFTKFKNGSQGFCDCYSYSQQQPVYSSTM